MSKERIEREFHEKLNAFSSDIDDEELWSVIEDRVPKKKKKRRFIFWIFFGLCLLLLISGLTRINSEKNAVAKSSTASNLAVKGVFEEDEANSLPQKSKSNDMIPSYENSFNTIHRNEEPNETVKNIGVTVQNNNLPNKTMVSPQSSSPQFNENDIVREEIVILEVDKRFLLEVNSDEIIEKVKIRNILRRPKRPIQSSKNRSGFLRINYYAGLIDSKLIKSIGGNPFVDYGENYFSQGVDLSYGKLFSPNIYGKVILGLDLSYKKYEDKVYRDTLVPSSSGSQILSSTEFSNGTIDTEFGIPIVNGVYNRDVIKLNTIRTLSIGLGIGYMKRIGRLNLHFELDAQRSFQIDFVGLGRVENGQYINNLKSFNGYFSQGPLYTVSGSSFADYRLTESFYLSFGAQYQQGLSSVLAEESGHSEKLRLLRGSIGLVFRI
ncbi:MAG: hypothetical protein AAGA77_17065 [Bacteroidota bacterium]